MGFSIVIYGGVHHDPGTRQRFIEELGKRDVPPHFIAVEWEESFFNRCAAYRPRVEKCIKQRWNFLTPSDCRELSLALAWEGDAFKEVFPNAQALWLETGFQENRDPDENNDVAERLAEGLYERLLAPSSLTFNEFYTNGEMLPTSKRELVERLWRAAWADKFSNRDFERDVRWANMIVERSEDVANGWIAAVVGWAHANPEYGDNRLRSLLLAQGFSVTSVYLGP